MRLLGKSHLLSITKILGEIMLSIIVAFTRNSASSFFFNSSLFKYCFRDSFPELQGGTRELSKIFFDKIPVIMIDINTSNLFEIKALEVQTLKQQGIDTKQQEIEIDNLIFDLYNLADDERKTIGFIEIQ
jgi:hypothetical protein